MKAVAHYIPHRPPMRLIDDIVAADDEWVSVSARVARDNVFFSTEEHGVPAWVGIEYMAQAAAVWVGRHCERLGRSIQPAFLISSRQFTAHTPVFPEDAMLTVTVTAELVEPPIVAFRGRIDTATGESLAEAIFSAYQPEDVVAFLRESEPSGVGSPTSDV